MSLLTVQLDLVGALREAGGKAEPDPTQAAVIAEIAGADGIAVQFTRKKRFIRERDLYLLRGICKTKMTIEMPPVDELIEKVIDIKPWMVVFAADHADSNSPLSPIDFESAGVDFSESTTRLRGVGISVGFLVEPDTDEIRGASKAGADAVVINCGRYTEARTIEEAQMEIDKIDRAANSALKSNMTVLCSQGINYKNIRPLAELGVVDEFIIGSAICSRGLLVGLERAIREMTRLIQPTSQAD